MSSHLAEPRMISIAQARNRLTRLIHDAEEGTPITLTRRGRAVAVLVSATQFARLEGTSRSSWEALLAFRRRARLADIDVDAVFAGARDRSPGRKVRL